jgi:Zn-dependent peptidase ImmA (M78 family)/DNA-binding XRE family transcriptional regulator
MNFESTFGVRLRLSRRAAGLSLRQLAAAIDYAVSAQAIGQYEQGRMLPGSEIALRLAEALAVPLAYLMSPLQLRLREVEFRRHNALPARYRAFVEASVLEHADRYLQVENLLNLTHLPWRAPAGAPYAVTGPDDAEAAARRTREAWHLGLAPVGTLTEELEQHGIKVVMLDMPISVDGLSCRLRVSDNASLPMIVVSALVPSGRQRFVMAHELGHLVLTVAEPARLETACDSFAGAFLMPAEAVQACLGSRRHAFGYDELADIAQLFGVNTATVLNRLADLAIIDAGTRRAATRLIKSQRADSSSTIGTSERPRRFQRLVLRALAEGALSKAKAVELLKLNTEELERLMLGDPDTSAG